MKNVLLLLISCWLTGEVFAQNKDEIFTIVEDMPIYKGCETLEHKRELAECTQEKMYLYFKNKAEAIENKERGIIYISFVIDYEGKAIDPKILRGINGAEELDKEVISMVENLPLFVPGKQRDVAVNVKYAVPIKFK